MMKITKFLLVSIPLLIASSFYVSADNSDVINNQKFRDLLSRLNDLSYYSDSVKFVVGMPQLSEDIVYQVDLNQFPATDDPLSPCSYLINWSMTGREDPPFGFSAYFDGNHYRYSGSRLQEYHWTWDSIPFMPNELKGINSQGIHKTAQFVDLLPSMIAEKLSDIMSDPNYRLSFSSDTLVNGTKCTALRATMIINGVTASEQEYIFDASTLLPYRLHFENSPGSISEQTVDVYFGNNAVSRSNLIELNEDYLVSVYPDIFANFRESNFKIENLSGTKFPSFALPTLAGDRLSYRQGDSFKSPVIVALLDPDGGFNADYITSVRNAMASLPYPAEIIWAFTGTNPDRIEEQVGQAAGETVLINAKGLARDCGVSSFPVAIMVAKNGMVRDIILGFNNGLTTDILQKMALIND